MDNKTFSGWDGVKVIIISVISEMILSYISIAAYDSTCSLILKFIIENIWFSSVLWLAPLVVLVVEWMKNEEDVWIS